LRFLAVSSRCCSSSIAELHPASADIRQRRQGSASSFPMGSNKPCRHRG
jgi:hypothetical protein